jgi:glycosyltransferase involved in cell wall biosynthesis
LRIGIVTTVQPLGQGLHRVLACGLESALRMMGHDVECVKLPFIGGRDLLAQAWAIRTLHISESFDRVVTLRPPAHLIIHPHKVAWLSTHPDYGAPDNFEGQMLAAADRLALLAADRVFTTSATAAVRWEQRAGIKSSVLHAPALTLQTGTEPSGQGLLTAVHLGPDARGGRLPELAAALRRTQPGVRVHLCSGITDPILAEELALLAARLQPGRLTLDDRRLDAIEVAEMISKARAVLCLSSNDDIALAAIDRAAAGHRAAIVSRTCAAAVERILDGRAGIAVSPDDHSLAAALDLIATDPTRAAAMGYVASSELSTRPTWDTVTRSVLNE